MTILQVAVGVIKNPVGEILISLRNADLHQGGLWEFPGGKVEAGETVEQALRRELEEELGITALGIEPLITIKHDYGDRHVQLNVCVVRQFSGSVKHSDNQPVRWVAVDDLRHYAFPAANKPIVTAIQLPVYYAILDDADESAILTNLEKMLVQGIRLIQARFKRLSADAVGKIIGIAYPLCQRYGALLLVNSDMVCEGLVADGLHLTSSHLMATTQRPANQTWVSASCHNLAELRHAESIGVDFVVLAPVLATQSHANATPLGWDEFGSLVAQAKIPVYALGGLSLSDLTKARQLGAQGIAGISAFLG
jgi:8-oxo-dGTP diphosphatase